MKVIAGFILFWVGLEEGFTHQPPRSSRLTDAEYAREIEVDEWLIEKSRLADKNLYPIIPHPSTRPRLWDGEYLVESSEPREWELPILDRFLACFNPEPWQRPAIWPGLRWSAWYDYGNAP